MKVRPSRIVSDQAVLQARAVIVEQGVMRPGDRRARGQQDQRVEQRQIAGIEHLGALGRPTPPVKATRAY